MTLFDVDGSDPYGVPGWMYLATHTLDEMVVKVGWTKDVGKREHQHRRSEVTMLCAWPAIRLEERDFHHTYHRYRARVFRVQREWYNPIRPVVDAIVDAIDRADEEGAVKFRAGWNYRRVMNELEMRHLIWRGFALDDGIGE